MHHRSPESYHLMHHRFFRRRYQEALDDLDIGRMRAVLNVNVIGMVEFTKAFLPFLVPGSRLVNVGSIAGIVGLPGWTPYTASKFAVEALSDAWRR